MQKHTKIYLDYFSLGEQDFIPCEACGAKAVDIHHIYGRGKGKDTIDNLMALCRKHHKAAHETVKKDDMLYIHRSFIAGSRKQFLK